MLDPQSKSVSCFLPGGVGPLLLSIHPLEVIGWPLPPVVSGFLPFRKEGSWSLCGYSYLCHSGSQNFPICLYHGMVLWDAYFVVICYIAIENEFVLLPGAWNPLELCSAAALIIRNFVTLYYCTKRLLERHVFIFFIVTIFNFLRYKVLSKPPDGGLRRLLNFCALNFFFFYY